VRKSLLHKKSLGYSCRGTPKVRDVCRFYDLSYIKKIRITLRLRKMKKHRSATDIYGDHVVRVADKGRYFEKRWQYVIVLGFHVRDMDGKWA